MTSSMERQTGPDAWLDLKRRTPEVTEWYDVGFHQRVFEGGRVDPRLKELLRLKLSMTHGCHT